VLDRGRDPALGRLLGLEVWSHWVMTLVVGMHFLMVRLLVELMRLVEVLGLLVS